MSLPLPRQLTPLIQARRARSWCGPSFFSVAQLRRPGANHQIGSAVWNRSEAAHTWLAIVTMRECLDAQMNRPIHDLNSIRARSLHRALRRSRPAWDSASPPIRHRRARAPARPMQREKGRSCRPRTRLRQTPPRPRSSIRVWTAARNLPRDCNYDLFSSSKPADRVLPPPAPVVIVRDDDGGQILAFLERLAEYRRKGVHVRIEGACESACTVLTALPSERLCVGPNAVLGFHESYVRQSGIFFDSKVRSDEATAYLMKIYPKRLRDWIRHHGGLKDHLLLLSGTPLTSMFRRCATE